jgi:hypothetical protein
MQSAWEIFKHNVSGQHRFHPIIIIIIIIIIVIIIIIIDRLCGQSSWLQMQRFRVRFPALSDFLRSHWGWNRVHSASWVQLRSCLKEKNSGFCLDSREYGRRDPPRWPRGILYPQNLALASPTSGVCSVGIIRSRTKAMEFIIFFVIIFFRSLFMTITDTSLYLPPTTKQWYDSCRRFQVRLAMSQFEQELSINHPTIVFDCYFCIDTIQASYKNKYCHVVLSGHYTKNERGREVHRS